MRAGKKMVPLYPADKERLDEALGAKLARLARAPLPDVAESNGRSKSPA